MPKLRRSIRRTDIACQFLVASIAFSARRDRPDDLDLAVAHADVPVVEVASRIAMPVNDFQLFIDAQNAEFVFDHSVFVQRFDVSHVVPYLDNV